MRVKEQQKTRVHDPPTARVSFLQRVTREEDTEAAREIFVPFVLSHFDAIGLEPDDVLARAAVHSPALEKVAAAEDWMVAPQRD